MQRSKDGGEGTAPGDEDGELTKAAEEHQRRRPPSSLYRVRAGTRRERREPGLVDNFSIFDRYRVPRYSSQSFDKYHYYLPILNLTITIFYRQNTLWCTLEKDIGPLIGIHDVIVFRMDKTALPPSSLFVSLMCGPH